MTEKRVKIKAVILKNGEISFSKTIPYPKTLMNKIKKTLLPKEGIDNFTQAMFYIIEEHEKNNISDISKAADITKDSYKKVKGKDCIRKCTRFREKHYRYINNIAEAKKIDLTKATVNIVNDYFYWIGQ